MMLSFRGLLSSLGNPEIMSILTTPACSFVNQTFDQADSDFPFLHINLFDELLYNRNQKLPTVFSDSPHILSGKFVHLVYPAQMASVGRPHLAADDFMDKVRSFAGLLKVFLF